MRGAVGSLKKSDEVEEFGLVGQSDTGTFVSKLMNSYSIRLRAVFGAW